MKLGKDKEEMSSNIERCFREGMKFRRMECREEV